ncbi:RING zinc finger-containing protein [Tieghemostelium lacteum]|uniref:RING zinc finger-containing protein n=1 Tax=Tieghemostelium lacteum TaxID=361077 RepID=A0A151Z854_TIELA|nr:RING zinc finger-containing protein [Tieghemostelium lacteum]|eukprot:KYQ90115.1 RING zinc finger-containing protein [Tieghemostelium lacteum]
MDELLKCPNCLKIFDQPRSLDCNHIFCKACLEILFKPGISPYITCSLCEKDTLVLHANLENLSTVHCIDEMLKYRTGDYEKACSQQPTRISDVVSSGSAMKLLSIANKISEFEQIMDQNNSNSKQSTPRKGNTTTTTTTTTSSSVHTPLNGSKEKELKSSPLVGSINKASGIKLLNSLTIRKPSSPSLISLSTNKSSITLSQSNSSRDLTSSPPPVTASLPPLMVSPPPPISLISDDIYDPLTKCLQHQEYFKFFCMDCDKLICLECIILHNGHQFNKIPNELEKNISDIELLLVSVGLNPNKLVKQKQSIEKRLQESQVQYKETKQKITGDIDTIIKNLQERKEQLEQQVDKEWEDQKKQLNDQITKISQNMSKTQESISQSQMFIQEYQNLLLVQRQRSQTIATPTTINHVSNAQFDKVSSLLLKKYIDLKQLDEDSGNLCNELIMNIEWKWDPEFQFPQLFSKANGQPTTVIYRKRTNSTATSPVVTSPSLQSTAASVFTTPPQASNSTTLGTSISSDVVSKLNLSLSTSSIPQIQIQSPIQTTSLVQNPLTKQNSFIISIKSSGGGSKDTNSVVNHILNNISNGNGISTSGNSIITSSGGISDSPPPLQPNSMTSSSKLQFKNPVFGKLLTRKDSTVTLRRHYIYGIGSTNPERMIEIYDTSNNKWKFGSACPIQTSEFTCIYDYLNFIYLFGGKESPQDIYRYSIDKNSWIKMDVQIPTKRYGHCTVYDGTRYIYIIGGRESSSKSLERFDTQSLTFTKLQSMKFPRNQFHCFYNQSKKCIYAVDGYVNKERHSSIEIYDIESNKWSVLTEIKQPRYFAGVSFDSTRYIHIIGGIDRSTSKDLTNKMEKFDTFTKQWEVLDPSSLQQSSSSVPPPPHLSKSLSNMSISSLSSANTLAHTSNITPPSSPMNSKQSIGPIPTDKIQLFNCSLFDGDQFFYYFGINIDESCPLLYRFNIRAKKFEKLSSLSQLNLFSQLIMVSK